MYLSPLSFINDGLLDVVTTTRLVSSVEVVKITD